MALKFTKRVARRSSNLTVHKRKILVQVHARDEFGELAGKKRAAAAEARRRGHDLKGWHRRANDPAGRWNSFCESCNKALVVCTEAPEGFQDIYGPAYLTDCATGESEPSPQ